MTDTTLFAGRYTILRTLGAGGMGIVYAVEDGQKDHHVMALKVMKTVGDADALESYKAEFRNILGVKHPNIPQVFDFGQLPPPENAPYFTTEFIDGWPLGKLVQNPTPQQIEQILVKLCRALAFLHSRGLLHRDIKPDNVLGNVSADGEITVLKLVDFGLAAQNDARRGETCGTLDYMAPEIIAGEAATVQSDLYALGILLYELATGRQPFVGDDRLALSRKRCEQEAPPPFHFRPDLPVGLSDAIGTLIRIKPEERPASARHTIALLNEREGTEFPYETDRTRQAYIASGGVVSHSAVRETLAQKKQCLLAGETLSPTVIIGPRGLGRFRLLRDFAAELSLAGCSCVTIHRDDDWNTPQLGTCSVLLIPDISKVSRALLREKLERAPERVWLILGLNDPDDDLLSALPQPEIIQLQPLSCAETQAFVAATFAENSFDDDFVRRVYSLSLGFPVAIQQILENLVRDNLLQIGLSGWELALGPWDETVHARVREYVARRSSTLPPESLHVLHVLCCTDTPLPSAVISDACKRNAVSLPQALAPLQELGWCQQDDDDYSLIFAALRECVRTCLDQTAQQTFHLDLLRAWSNPEAAAHPLCRRERLYHDFASQSFQSEPETVASVLRSALDSGDGKWVHRFCESVTSQPYPDRYRRALLEIHAALEYQEGNLEQAAALMEQFLDSGALEVREDTLGPLARYAAIEEHLGHTEHAHEILSRCRAALPAGCSPQAGAVFGPLAWMAFKQGEREQASELAEEGLVRVQTSEMDTDHAVLWNTVAMLRYYTGDYDSAALAWRRCLTIFERLNDQQGIARMNNNLGAVAAQAGNRNEARKLWKKSAEISREIGDVQRLAGLYNNLGIDALEAGALLEAEEYYAKALAIFRRLKHQREQMDVLSNLGELMFFRADYARAEAYLHEAVALARSLGDEEGQIEPLVHLGKLQLVLEQLEASETLLHDAARMAERTGAKHGEAKACEGLALLWARKQQAQSAQDALKHAQALISADSDPLAALGIQLTRCQVAVEFEQINEAGEALTCARHMSDLKDGSYAAAQLCLQGVLWSAEAMDARTHKRRLKLLSAYPELLWRFHWAEARRLTQSGGFRQALESYGRGVNVLKSIATHLTEHTRTSYFAAPHIARFKEEALQARKHLA